MSEKLIRAMFDAAIAAADPAVAVRDHLQHQPIEEERIVIVSVGKAAVAMARGAAEMLGERIVAGVAISKAESATLPAPFQHHQGSHPIPDERSVAATHAVIETLRAADERDHVLCLISGGASALLTAPLVALEQWREINDALLRCGCTINEVNHIRQQLDQVKGGGLLNWIAPTPCTTLILSDVIGNNIAHIGSGPTVPTERDTARFWDIFERYNVARFLSAEILTTIKNVLNGVWRMEYGAWSTEHHIIGDIKKSAEAAAQIAHQHGYTTSIISTELTGEAAEVGARLAREARALPQTTCHIYGGETTVTLSADKNGVGGRNQELALAAAIELAGTSGVWVGTLATDGEDGANDAAGSIVDGGVISADNHSIAQQALRDHDSYTFFTQHPKAHLRIGPTGTNVNDLTVLLSCSLHS